MFAHKLVPRPSSQRSIVRMTKTLSFHTSNDVLSAKKNSSLFVRSVADEER